MALIWHLMTLFLLLRLNIILLTLHKVNYEPKFTLKFFFNLKTIRDLWNQNSIQTLNWNVITLLKVQLPLQLVNTKVNTQPTQLTNVVRVTHPRSPLP